VPCDRKFLSSTQLLRQEIQLHRPEKIPKAVVKIDQAPEIGNNNAVKIRARMPITRVTPRVQPKVHKGDEVDLNSGDSPKNPMSGFLIAALPLFLVARNQKNGKGRGNGVVK